MTMTCSSLYRIALLTLCLSPLMAPAACNFATDLDEVKEEAEARRNAELGEPSALCLEYCMMEEEACDTSDTEIFDNQDDCFTACADYPDNGIRGERSGNTVFCRIDHLRTALDDPITHCPHAAPDGGGTCIGLSPCGAYCATIREDCRDFHDFGEEDFSANCLAACDSYPMTGSVGDETGDTFECRNRAASMAVVNAAQFCPEALPDGGGACVDEPM